MSERPGSPMISSDPVTSSTTNAYHTQGRNRCDSASSASVRSNTPRTPQADEERGGNDDGDADDVDRLNRRNDPGHILDDGAELGLSQPVTERTQSRQHARLTRFDEFPLKTAQGSAKAAAMSTGILFSGSFRNVKERMADTLRRSGARAGAAPAPRRLQRAARTLPQSARIASWNARFWQRRWRSVNWRPPRCTPTSESGSTTSTTTPLAAA